VNTRTADEVIQVLNVQTTRLRDLVTDVVAAAFDQPAPAWGILRCLDQAAGLTLAIVIARLPERLTRRINL
jgi:hypothetical protein